jgi:hypothetical protein
VLVGIRLSRFDVVKLGVAWLPVACRNRHRAVFVTGSTVISLPPRGRTLIAASTASVEPAIV